MHKEGYDILDQHSCIKDHSHLITFKIFLTHMKFHTDFYVYDYMSISLMIHRFLSDSQRDL